MESFHPRLYQLYIYEHALRTNTLAFLPTGSGKTLISILLIKHYLNKIQQGFEVENIENTAKSDEEITKELGTLTCGTSSKRMIAFVAPTKILVHQQRAYIAGNCNAVVRSYTGEANKRAKDWAQELVHVDIMVMTPELLRHALERQHLQVSSFALIILDECHNVMGRNPMAIVCELIRKSSIRPRILGLTASPIQAKKGLISVRIQQLEEATNCKLVTPPEGLLGELREVMPIPNVVLLRYEMPLNVAPFGIKSEDLLCAFSSAGNHLRAMGRIQIPDNCAHSLLHSYMRLRQSNNIYTIYKLANTVQMKANQIADFDELNMPVECNTTEGGLLVELQQVLSQVMRIAEDCGLLGALYSLRESIHPNSNGTKFGMMHKYTEKASNKRPYRNILDDHLLDIDITKLQELKEEVVKGPFHNRGLTEFRQVGVHSITDCFVAIAANFDAAVLKEATAAFLHVSNGGKQQSHKKMSQNIVYTILTTLSNGQTFSYELGSLGCLSVLFPCVELPPIGIMCMTIATACDCLLNSMSKQNIVFECDIRIETLRPDAIPMIDDHDLDSFTTLHDFYATKPNIRYPLISNKAKALVSYVLSAMNDPNTSPDWAAVVFCRMRPTVVSLSYIFTLLSHQLNNHSSQDGILSQPIVRLISRSIVGRSKQSDQIRTLMEFKASKFNILFATDVAEEGLDIKSCQLVINFDMPTTLRSMIQRRGRARAENSTIVMLAPLAIEGNKLIHDIGTLFKQEMDLEQHMRENIKAIIGTQDVSIDDDDPLDLSALQESVYEKYSYTVTSTGARIDIRTCVQTLVQYCQSLPKDSYFIPQPIFWFDRIEASGTMFRCAVLLPIAVPPQCRCALGPVCSSKILSKSIAALECIKMLHQAGELDDNFQILVGKSLCPPSTYSYDTRIMPGMDISNQSTKEDVHEEMDVVGSHEMKDTILIETKSVPDLLTFKHVVEIEPNNSTHALRILYLYSAKVYCLDVHEAEITNSCRGCKPILDAFSEYGFAIPSPIPDEVMRTGFDMSLRANQHLKAELLFLGRRQVTDEETLQMQRFHRAVLAWETEGECPPVQPEKAEEWTKSSNGLYYTLFPFQRHCNTDSYSYTDSQREFQPPLDWIRELTRGADEAQSLIYNLIDHKNKYEREIEAKAAVLDAVPLKARRPLTYYGAHSATSLEGYILSAGPHKLQVGLSSYPKKRLVDPMDEDIPLEKQKSFLAHYRDEGLVVEDDLNKLAANEDHSMVCTLSIAGKLAGFQLLGRVLGSNNTEDDKPTAAQPHRHAFISYLLPEYCRPLGKAVYYYIGLTAPCLLWRVQSFFLAQEAGQHVVHLYTDWILNQKQLQPCPPSEVVSCQDVKAPDVSLLLEAITPRMCVETINSERIEMLGDSFLKLAVTTELFALYPEKHEGGLTALRSRFVSNEHLTVCAKQLDVLKYMRAIPVLSGRQVLNFEPPGRSSRAQCDDAQEDSMTLWNKLAMVPEKVTGSKRSWNKKRPSSTTFTRLQYNHARVKPKCLADLLEACIGAFYLHGGFEGGVSAVKALGCWPKRSQQLKPSTVSDDHEEMPSVVTACADAVTSIKEELDAIIIPDGYPVFLAKLALGKCDSFSMTLSKEDINNNNDDPEEAEEMFRSSLPSDVMERSRDSLWYGSTVDGLEKKLGYRFRNLFLLEEATTHCSIQHKTSNQRLEFLGDAILDFAVVALLWQSNPQATQGDLSSQKSACTANVYLGTKAIELGLQRYLTVMSSPLQNEFKDIQLYLDSIESSALLDTKMDLEFVSSGCLHALADFFEALIGAIYLDSGSSMEVVQQVVTKISLIPQLKT